MPNLRKPPIGSFRTLVVATLLVTQGCVMAGRKISSAKWAIDDQQYAQEHSEPYSTDRRTRAAQQTWDASDASFQEGRSGVYIGGGSTAQHWPAATGSLGIFKLPTSWSTVRGGVFGMDNDGIGLGGVQAGVRVHAPTRFTPYLGIEGDLGMSGLKTGYARHQTNSGQPRKTITSVSGLAAVVPEAGVSYWLNSSTRVNAGASYYITSLHQPDFLLFGVSVEFLSGDDFHMKRTGANLEEAPPRRSTFDDDTEQPYFLDGEQSANPVPMFPAENDATTGSGNSFALPPLKTVPTPAR